jgi:hypothetical protein
MFKATLAAGAAVIAIGAAFALPNTANKSFATSSVRQAVSHAPAVKRPGCQSCSLTSCPMSNKSDCGPCPANSCGK